MMLLEIGGLKEAAILDYSTEGPDVNVENNYTTDKYQYIRWYQDNGDESKTVRQEYNVSFNNTYSGIPIFKTEGKQRIYISPKELCDIIEYMNGYHGGMLRDANNGGDDAEIKAFFADINKYWVDLNDVYYYTNAYDFSKKVNDDIFKKIILDLNPGDADHPNNNYSVVSDAYNTKYTAYFEFDEKEGKSDHEDERYYLHEKYNYGDKSKFVFHSWDSAGTTLDLVNPDLDTSLFNQHRIDVITSCIEYSFANAVENFNAYMESAYRYKVPDISEADWGRICNNISCLTMMQGMPIGNYKFYNNYSLVVDNKVNEYTPKSGIYVEDNYQHELSGGGTGIDIPNSLKYTANPGSVYQGVTYKTNIPVIFHNPGCSEYSDAVNTTREVIGYRLIDYDIDSYTPPADLKGYLAYDTVEKKPPDGANRLGQQIYFYLRPGTGCYNCVISQNKLDFSLDDLLAFRKKVTLGTGEEHNISNNVRQAYFRALARERGAKARFSSDTSGKKVFGTYQS